MKFSEFLLLEDEAIASAEGSSTTNVDVTDNPLGVYSRTQMPQITKPLYQEFLADLSIHNIGIDSVNKRCKELTPTQTEFNDEKVKSIQSAIADGTYQHEPLLVSSDNCIVDGHHRWKAFNPSDTILSNVVDLKFNELYEFLQNKPYIFNKAIHERAQ